MKRPPWLLASSLGFLALANAPLACVSNTAAPPVSDDAGGLPPEDGAPPAEDGTAPPHDATPPSSDAGPTDASEDSGDAGPQTLTLTVLSLGSPEPGVSVVFQDLSGNVLTTATTDSTGSVTQVVTAGSQVTVLLGSPTSENIVTIQDVAPGDSLTIVDSPNSPPPTETDLSVTLPAPTWDASSAAEYVYAGGCQQSIPNPLYLEPACESAGSFPLFARAVDSTSQQEIAYTYQTGNPVPDGGLPDGDTAYPISVSRPWATSTANLALTVTNPPSLADDAGAVGTSSDVNVYYYESAGGVVMSSPSSYDDTIDDAGTQSIGFVMHPGFPDFVQTEAIDRANLPTGGTMVAAAVTRSAPLSTSQTSSLDLSQLPIITRASIATAGVGTIAQPTVAWTSSGSLAAANGVFVAFQWYAEATDGGDQESYGTWTILSPATVASVQAPALPPSLAAWAPPSDAEFGIRPRVGAVQASFLTGYAGLRAVFGGLPFLSGYQIVVPILPVNGTMYLVGIYQEEG